MDILKVIIPAAGIGTRFLPFSKSVPKELVPLLNKPAIHYVVQECIDSEVKSIAFVTSKRKESLANYFDEDKELELFLEERGKKSLLSGLDSLIRSCNFTYIRQAEPRGLGHALWTARNVIDKEYFGVCLPDDILISQQPALAQLIKIARQEKASVIAVAEVPNEAVSNYGIIEIKKQLSPSLFQVSKLVEKPKLADAPSRLAIIGRYVLSHKLFAALEEVEADVNGELQLTDGICQMLYNNEKVFAYKVQGIRYDVGTPVGWIKSIIGAALQHPDYSQEIREYLADTQQLEHIFYTGAKIKERSL